MRPTPKQITFYEGHGNIAAKTAAIVENALPLSAMPSLETFGYLEFLLAQLQEDTTNLNGGTAAVCQTLDMIAGAAIAAHERFHRDIKRLSDDIEAANMQDTEAPQQRDTGGRSLDT